MSGKESLQPPAFEQKAQFFGQITGLQVQRMSVFPELTHQLSPKHKLPFSWNLDLGNSSDQYSIQASFVFTDEYEPGEWLPEISWEVRYNGDPIYRSANTTISSFFEQDIIDQTKLASFLLDEVDHMLGGPSSEIPFMDYEQFTLESLTAHDSYFVNIYLVLMTHMKARGLVMPPILGKLQEIREPMQRGNINEVERNLQSVLVYGAGAYDQRCQAHMQAEAAEIRERAHWEYNKRDPSVPIEEAFPFVQYEIVNEGERIFHPINILIVENDIDSPRQFTHIVKQALRKDGRYKGTKLVRTVALQDCMELAAARRIDLILFDWTNPSVEESLMVIGDHNPFFGMMHGEAQAVLHVDDSGVQYDRSDGRHFDRDSLKQESKRQDIRELWMNKVREACDREQVNPPPYFIIRSAAEHQDIAKIISQRVGNPIS